MTQIVKGTIRKFLALFGVEVRRLLPLGSARNSQRAALKLAVRNGLIVNTVIDIGAAYGNWTRMSLDVLPQAKYVLVEPLDQYEEWLCPVLEQHPEMVRVKAAAGAIAGRATIFRHADWVGSSLYHEAEGPAVDGAPTEVEVMTVDEIVGRQQLAGPFLLKVDVQGAELQVLSGATATLRRTEYVVAETSLFQFFKEGPLIQDVVAFMQQQGFVVYDILEPQYRLLDNALGQVDLVFVPERSPMRQEHVYASPAQRKEQAERMRRSSKVRRRQVP